MTARTASPGVPDQRVSRYTFWLWVNYLVVGLLFGASVWHEFSDIDEHVQSIAQERGGVLFRMIELTRLWNAEHGGVYVPVTPDTQPNPYLKHPRRDLSTQDGQQLTMVNPAFMTRQIAEIAEKTDGVHFHITSLKPIRPANAADAWEVSALQAFEAGQAKDRLELIRTPDRVYHRFMAPLYVQQACLNCHAEQGYRLGDVRGGISIDMPADVPLALADRQRWSVLWKYGLVAAAVGLLLHWVLRQTYRHLDELHALGQQQEALIAERTQSLSVINERLRLELLERERARQRLKIAATVVENAAEGVIVTDADNRIIEVNPAFSRITGYLAEDVLGHNPRILASGRHDLAFYQGMWQALQRAGHWEGEIWNRRRDGSVYPQWLSITCVPAASDCAERGQHVATFTDITQRKELEAWWRHQAQTDPLTDLPNRSLFLDRLTMALNQAQRYQETFALLYLDLDRFKEVNDTMGHAAGDELLIEASRRLLQAVRDSDTVARLGGDEFAIILTKLQSQQEAQDIAGRIVEALSQPFTLNDGLARVSASVGLAFYPQHADDVHALVQAADRALYAMKQQGRNGYQLFRPDGMERPPTPPAQ